MLEYIKDIDEELQKRYDTLYIDLCTGSSSFFAAYRSLCERLMKIIVDGSPMKEAYSGKTLTFMLSHSEVAAYLTDTLGIPSTAVQKIKDYVLKINKQIHSNEKDLTDTLAKSYMFALDAFLCPYALHLGLSPERITENDILDAFMSTPERIISSEAGNQRELSEIGDLLNEMHEMLAERSDKDSDGGNTKEDPLPSEIKKAAADLNARNVVHQFKISATKHLLYFGSGEVFSEDKKRCLWLALSILISAVPITWLSILAAGIYTTYTLFENIWYIAAIFLTIGILRTHYSNNLYDAMDAMPAVFDGYLPYKVKRRYLVFLILASIATLLNIFMMCMSDQGGIFTFLYSILAISNNVVSYILYYRLTELINCFAIVSYTDKAHNGKTVTFMEHVCSGQHYTAEEYCKRFNRGKGIILK